MKYNKPNSTTLKWIFKHTKKYIPFVAIISVNSCVISVLFVALALLSKKILDIATGSSQGNMLFYSILLFSVIIIQVVLNGLSTFLNSYTSGKLTISLRDYLFETVNKKKYSDISQYHSGDLLNRFTSDTSVVVSGVVGIIPSIFSMVSKLVAGIGALIYLNKMIALLVLVIGITFPAIGRLISKKYKYMHKEFQRTEGQARSFLQECFENIVVIKTFSSEIPFINKLNQYMDKNFKIKLKKTGISILTNLSLYTFFTMGYYAVLLWGAHQLSSGAITYGTLTAFLQLVSQVRTPLQNISGIIPQYYSTIASAERLMEIENKADEKIIKSHEELQNIKESFNSLEINNISFKYTNTSIIKNCSFIIEKGKITAITGESGSGKSTLFKILLGLYEPQEGNITINHTFINDSSLRNIFSYVPQGNMVLSGTIKENITLCDTSIPDEQIIQATKTAEIYDFILSTENGFNTVLSERGAGLSEGQIQRISIARALLANTPIILLDEATSALDENTETRLLSNIKNLTDKTILFITHRNTSLSVCDTIYHMENKKFIKLK